MMPVECMAAGRPVIGLYAGGLKESVRAIKPWEPLLNNADLAGATGVAIRADDRALVRNIEESVKFFIRHEAQFSSKACIQQAAAFAPDRFFAAWEKLMCSMGIEAERSAGQGVVVNA